jgi:hypothetical protein
MVRETVEMNPGKLRREVAIGAIWFTCGAIVCTAAMQVLFCRGVPRYDVALFAWPFVVASGIVAIILGIPISWAISIESSGRSLRNIFVAALLLTVVVVLLVAMLSLFIKPVTDCAPGFLSPQAPDRAAYLQEKSPRTGPSLS